MPAIAEKMGIDGSHDPELDEVEQDVAPRR